MKHERIILLSLLLLLSVVSISATVKQGPNYQHLFDQVASTMEQRILHYPSPKQIQPVNSTDLIALMSHNMALVSGHYRKTMSPKDQYQNKHHRSSPSGEEQTEDQTYVLQPKLLWNHFAVISAIPRPPKQEQPVAHYVRDYLLERLPNVVNMTVDERSGSMLFTIPAAHGYEHTPTIVVQSHLDMVCECDPVHQAQHNCSRDGITLLMANGTWVNANRTSLGADNGIAVAMMMTLAEELQTESKLSKQHGKIELLFTVEEEIGLRGALRMSKDFFTGNIILNLDTMVPDQLTVGSAGGQDTVAEFEIQYMDDEQEEKAGTIVYDIELVGLKGGHSGNEIHMGRGNAIKLLARLLLEVDRELGANKRSYHISQIQGGTKRNAIPRDAKTTIHVESRDDISVIEQVVKRFTALINEVEYKGYENVTIHLINKIGIPQSKPFASNYTRHILRVLQALPSGPLSYSYDFPAVQTSTNLAVVATDTKLENMEDNRFHITLMTRSLLESAKNETSTRIRSILELANASYINDTMATYPSWTPKLGSQTARRAIVVYDKLFDKEPKLLVSQSGLECAVIASKRQSNREDIEMLSMGPLIEQPHSPEERVHIDSVLDSYNFLKHLISDIAEFEKI